jgi:tubulin monoglycylase TTLL3/8
MKIKMPKFTVYRNHSPKNKNQYLKSVLKPVDAIKTPGFSLGLPQTTIIYPQNDLSRYRIRTVLAARIERRVVRSAAKTPDVDSLWPKNSIPNKDNGSFSKLLKNGIKIKKITSQPNPKYLSITHLSKQSTEDVRQKRTRNHKSLENQEKDSVDALSDTVNVIIKNSSLDEQCSEILHQNELPKIWSPVKRPVSPKTGRSMSSCGRKKKFIKKVEKVSVKEAMRDKEWISKARTQLVKDFGLQVNKSNGLAISNSEDPVQCFKYYLGPGNNSKLVKQLLSSRWWWVRVPEEEKDSANFVWTQWKEWPVINALPSLSSTKHETEPTPSISIETKTKYAPVCANNLLTTPKIVDISPLGYDLIFKSLSFTHLVLKQTYSSLDLKLHNKLEHNYHLSNKKALFYNLVNYYQALQIDPYEVIPLTFHIKTGETDPEFLKFMEKFKEFDLVLDENGKKPINLWIVKPGENSNRGNGISVVSDINSVKQELKNNPFPSTGPHTFIIQKYLEKPYLVNKRKFDIRCYAMITSLNGFIQGYFYQEGYIRTTSKAFSLTNNNKFVHLTNDAVQKKSDDYGKFEKANKMSYIDFQRYLDSHHSPKVSFFTEILPEIKKIVKDSIQAVYLKIDINKRGHCFEVFGYDFLLDSNLKPWLLEVNTNPCLELSSPHLARIIPAMLDNSFRIAVDPLFPEPNSKKVNTEVMSENKYELIFNSLIDGRELLNQLEELGTLAKYLEVDCSLLEMVNEESEEHPEDEEGILT